MKYRIIIILSLSTLGSGCAREDKRYQVPGLEEMLTDKDPDNRATAAEVLGSYGAEAKGSVPLLAVALKDESATVRICVAYGLADIGPDALAAEPALVEALAKDADAKVRTGAAYALGTIKPKSATARAALRKAASSDRVQGVREEAARSWRIIQGSTDKNQAKARRPR